MMTSRMRMSPLTGGGRRLASFLGGALGLGCACLGLVTSAQAAEHLMVVQELFPGTPEDPGAQYVMLRMTAKSQTLVSGTFITVEDPNGALLGRFGTMTHNVANGGPPFPQNCSYPNCPAILLGTASAQSLLGFAFDEVVDGQAGRVALPLEGGRVCFIIGAGTFIDCVAYGSFSAPNTMPPSASNACDLDLGAPASALTPGYSLSRTVFNCASKENSTDFSTRFPHPVANSGANANGDTDADGLINVLDCDDADPEAWYAPVQIMQVDIDDSGPPVLFWASQAETAGPSVLYDVISADAGELTGSGDFSLSACMARGHPDNFIEPVALPQTGDATLFYVRARTACGRGTYGDSDLLPDPRDFLDDPVNGPCQ